MSLSLITLVFVAAFATDFIWIRTIHATSKDRIRAVLWGTLLGLTSFVALYFAVNDWRYLPADLLGGALGLWVGWGDEPEA